MSQRREKRLRQVIRTAWRADYAWWLQCKPPFWRFISRRLWKKRRPIPPKGEKRSVRQTFETD